MSISPWQEDHEWEEFLHVVLDKLNDLYRSRKKSDVTIFLNRPGCRVRWEVRDLEWKTKPSS